MGQAEVFRVLRKNRRYMTVAEMCEEIGCTSGCLSTILKRMKKHGEVEPKDIKTGQWNRKKWRLTKNGRRE